MDKVQICFACIIRTVKGGFTLEIPDLCVTVSGKNYVEVVANGIETLTAIYCHRVERNVPIHAKETFESCMEKIRKEHGKHCVYMLQPSADLM